MSTTYFGERWDAPAFDEAIEVDTPVGEPCGLCEVKIKLGDQGTTMRFAYDGGPAVRSVHLGCMLRSVLGSPDHLLGKCSCFVDHSMEDRHMALSEGDDYTEGLEVLRILRERMDAAKS